MKPEWYEGETLEGFLSLKSNCKKLSDTAFQKLLAKTVRHLFYFTRATDFFGQKYRLENMSDKDVLLLMSQDTDVLFVGELLLQITSIIQFKAKPVSIIFFNNEKYLLCLN